MRTLRRLVLGETWTLPLGIAAAVGAVVVIRLVAGEHGWFAHDGGWLLFGGLVVALVVAVVRPDRRSLRDRRVNDL